MDQNQMVGPAIEADMDAASLMGPTDSDEAGPEALEFAMESFHEFDEFLDGDAEVTTQPGSSRGSDKGDGGDSESEPEVDKLFERGPGPSELCSLSM